MDPSMALVGFLKRLEGRLDVLSPCQEPGVSLSSVRWAGAEFLGHGEGSELGREQVLEALAVFGLFSGVGPDEEVTQASVEGKEGLTRLLFRPLQLRLGLVDTGGVYKHLFMRCNQAIQRPSLGNRDVLDGLSSVITEGSLEFQLSSRVGPIVEGRGGQEVVLERNPVLRRGVRKFGTFMFFGRTLDDGGLGPEGLSQSFGQVWSADRS